MLSDDPLDDGQTSNLKFDPRYFYSYIRVQYSVSFSSYSIFIWSFLVPLRYSCGEKDADYLESVRCLHDSVTLLSSLTAAAAE